MTEHILSDYDVKLVGSERDVTRVRTVLYAAHRARDLLRARATVALPPSAMAIAYKLAIDELLSAWESEGNADE